MFPIRPKNECYLKEFEIHFEKNLIAAAINPAKRIPLAAELSLSLLLNLSRSYSFWKFKLTLHYHSLLKELIIKLLKAHHNRKAIIMPYGNAFQYPIITSAGIIRARAQAITSPADAAV